MAKVYDQMTGEKLARHSSFNRQFYFREWRGKMIAQAKPKKRGHRLSERQAIAVDKFQQAAVLAKEAAPSQQLQAELLSQGTQYFARDLLYMAIYGRLAHIELTDGRKLFSVASKQSVSELLDAIAQEVGQLMFRNTDGWEPIANGLDHQVLTFLEGRPIWADPSGGGGTGGYFSLGSQIGGLSSRSTSGYATKGTRFRPYRPIRLERLQSFSQAPTTGVVMALQVVELASDDENAPVIADLGVTPDQPQPVGTWIMQDIPLIQPIDLEPGKVYMVAVTRRDGPVGLPVATAFIDSAQGAWRMNAPVETLAGTLQYQSLRLQINDTPGAVGTGTYFNSIAGQVLPGEPSA